ncbi:MAG TPA: conjugative transposon protein TraJ, partial [Chitinophagaceae bacterium]|nr:conjugative transposon protein TraJ [Chitinophagaceae bacterium]
MATCRKAVCMAVVGLILPFLTHAQAVADDMKGMHSVLDQLYDEMMPLCSQLIGVGQGLAGFAAMWYIAARVWRHLANAEPIDFYPLFRPFVIGFCVLIFPSILGLINVVMKPTVTATAAMVEGSDKAIAVLLEKKKEAIKQSNVWQMYVGESGSGDRDRWYKYTHDNADPSDEGFFESIGNDIKFAMSKASYNFRNSVKEWMSEVLQVLFEAAALCIDTLRTFQLIVLAILGPLVFGIAVFDGFQHTLTVWLARYINIFLWLPVANIFGSIIGKIQEKMLALDISQMQNYGETFFSRTDIAYLVFMIIGIVGYFTVPSVANYIVHAGGGSAFGHKITSMFSSSSRSMINTASTGAGMAMDAMGNAASSISRGMASNGSSNPYFKDSNSTASGYMSDKLKGNS